MDYATGLIGCWIMSDGVLSWFLYLRAESHTGKQQTFLRDHWVRLVRIICGIALMVIGAVA